MNREMRWCQIAGNAFIENSSKRLPFFGCVKSASHDERRFFIGEWKAMRKMIFLKKVTPLFEPSFFMFSKEETHSKGEKLQVSSFERCKNRGFKRGHHYIGTAYWHIHGAKYMIW